MSDSIPEAIHSADLTPRFSDGSEERRSWWWVASALLHGAILAAVFFLTPLREIVLPTPADQARRTQPDAQQREVTVSSQQAAQIMEHIEQREEEMLRDQVQQLLSNRDQIAQLNFAKQTEFQQFAQQMQNVAPQQAQTMLPEVLAAQQRAIDAQKAAMDAKIPLTGQLRELEQAANPESLQKAVDTAQNRARSLDAAAQLAQAEAAQAQERIIGQLSFAGEAFGEAASTQQEAAGRQREATDAQIKAAEAQSEAAAREGKIRNFERKLKAAARNLELEMARVQQVETGVERAKNRLQGMEARLQRAQDRAESADAKAAEKAAQELAQAESAVAEERRKVSEAEQAVEKKKAEVAAANDRLKEAQEAREAAWNEAMQAQEAAQMEQERAQEMQLAAVKSQAKAEVAMSQAIAKSANQPPATAQTSEPAQALETPDLSALELKELYDAAREIEQQSAEQYQMLRAAELAMIRQISMASAMTATHVATPPRPELDAEAFQNPILNAGQVDQRKAEIEMATQQTRSMLFLSNNMVTMALNGQTGSEQGTSVSVGLGAMQYNQMANAAMEDAANTAKDLSGLMQGARGPAPGIEGPGTGPSVLASGTVGSDMSGAMIEPPKVPKDLQALPGRKVLAGGSKTDWMYVDSWYIIGPFPNPQRVNVDTKFPPDSVVDLDASYVVGDGQVVRWQFQQSPRPLVVPANDAEYAIFYAYTELWFDQPRDLWIAVGSDDNSRLWINDQPVWISGYQLKSWRIDEGYRKVHFQQGRNRILYRIENGWKGSGFSLLVATGDEVEMGVR